MDQRSVHNYKADPTDSHTKLLAMDQRSVHNYKADPTDNHTKLLALIISWRSMPMEWIKWKLL